MSYSTRWERASATFRVPVAGALFLARIAFSTTIGQVMKKQRETYQFVDHLTFCYFKRNFRWKKERPAGRGKLLWNVLSVEQVISRCWHLSSPLFGSGKTDYGRTGSLKKKSFPDS